MCSIYVQDIKYHLRMRRGQYREEVKEILFAEENEKELPINQKTEI
jgi:hypothetical protein